jgi:TonB family protein
MERRANRLCPHFEMTSTFHSARRAASSAVAHLVPVRPMKHAANRATYSRGSQRKLASVYVALLVLMSASAGADTLSRLSDVFTRMPAPLYPTDAYWRSSNGWRPIEGTAICRVTLKADGTVAGVKVAKSSGSKKLDLASVTALREWRAKPGRPGRFYNIPIKFGSGRSTVGNDNGMGNDGLGIMRSRDR